MKQIRCAFFLFSLLAIGLAGCGPTDKAKPLTVGLLISQETEQTQNRVKILTAYFTKKLGMNVAQLPLSNSSAMIEAMRSRKIDVGTAGAFTYLVASHHANAEAIVTTAVTDGNPRFYSSCLITHKDSPLRSIDELLAHPEKYTLSWAYPTSTSGHLVPRYFLQTKGIMPEAFKEVFTSTDHTATIFSVLSRKIDVAAVSYSTLERFVKAGKMKLSDVRLLWLSEPIAPSPVFVRRDMDPALKKRIQRAYIDMATDDPAANKAMRTEFVVGVKYIAVTDSFYQPLRDMANKIKGLDMTAEN
jgi:phosphonate transport system substrate-binding protein